MPKVPARRHILCSLGLLVAAAASGQPARTPTGTCDPLRTRGVPPPPPLERQLVPLAARDDAHPPTADDAICRSLGRVRTIPSVVRASYQDGIPDGRGDGAATVASGISLHARAGGELVVGALSLRLAPELTVEENLGFETAPGADPTRSPLASPFYIGRLSADLPSRFGVTPRRVAVHPGETAVWWRPTGFAVGASTGQLTWGPRAGEGLVIGTSAPGIPRMEAQLGSTGRLRALTLRAFTGAVVESPYFDIDPANDWRPLSGLRAEWSSPSARLRLGVARTIMDGRRARWGRPRLREAATAPIRRAPPDSVIDFTSVDGEWRDPQAGSWGWVEVARQVPIGSLRDFLRQPTEGLALRFGGSQAIATDGTGTWFVSAEFVRLDQPQQRTDRPEQDLYTSASVVHGWTHRGQPLGSGLGPGGQRQLLGVDRVGARLRIGGFVERARWNDGMLYRQFLTGPFRHDVSIVAGLHASTAADPDRFSLRIGFGRRLNYLFQNDRFNPGYRTADLPLVRLSLTVTP